jgi:hypothetical protein
MDVNCRSELDVKHWESRQGLIWTSRRRSNSMPSSTLLEENRVLREHLGVRRIRFTDDQRRRLAVKARM